MSTSELAQAKDDVTKVAEDYYDSDDADAFYFSIWGGEDIHIGLYDTTDDIKEASRLTVEKMAERVHLDSGHKVLDVGAGYGGAARYLARTRGCKVHCLNISEKQNATNRRLTDEQGLSDKVSVVHGSFEDVPEPDETFDVVWSQDAILHSGDRAQVLREAFRVLKPGGQMIFTDPMEADDVPQGVLQPVYDRIHLQNLGSIAFYRDAAARIGFTEEGIVPMTEQVARHYGRVAQVLKKHYDDGHGGKISKDYMDRMLVGLQNWVTAGDAGHLAWGILHFRKPA